MSRSEVACLLSLKEAITAVEKAFNLYGRGQVPAPGILGIHVKDGGFHTKAGLLPAGRNYFASKTNANFPGNKQRGLPTIQGIIMLSDADDGRLLALMDSIEITILRTGAATAVAAKYLARPESRILTIVGCGNQGKVTARMLSLLFPLEKVFAYDIDEERAIQFAKELSSELSLLIIPVDKPDDAIRKSDICVTCTPAHKFFVKRADIAPGTFIAAVGSDSEDKHELEPELVASAKLVTDLTSQCAKIGELHHALERGLMKEKDVYAELGEIIAGTKAGRSFKDEIIIFDSTGMALQDVATSVIVYEKAIEKGVRTSVNFQN